ncbi:hypothetical protein H2202_001277 [Exophiala xenobiotica]|nr:hypothetical protein H2202_001277 [Exophiala xenobiotica]KAK5208902.1 hypothetical protein LTR41_005299 [Exophiala xenobiotica]KAK5261112.1 hypothetical protein LTR40_002851 [Exophiala xenobiotica]KAK5324981.1 hypothetical protein LTR93_004456 [Exophiala xenobiotica]KAK5352696.1 hypothetical protein LTR61_003822 [Exophiala xenobiotica]
MTRKQVTCSPAFSSTISTSINRTSDAITSSPDSLRQYELLEPFKDHHVAPQDISIPPIPSDKSKMHLISTALLIPGRGTPQQDMTIVIHDNLIHTIHSTSTLPACLLSLPQTHVPVLLPGLWDCHTHLLGIKSFNFAELLTTHPATAGARLVRNVRDILLSGFTSIRDLGGYAIELSRAISEDSLPGPNIYSAGCAISQTSGHGDVFDLPSDIVSSRLGVHSPLNPAQHPLLLADGPSECRKAVRLLIRRGATCIKVLASGGVLSISDDPLRQQFSDAELTTIVDEATRAGRVVAAHCHGKPGILAALHAGCHTIEHGTYLDQECVELMKAQGAIYVPTRTIVKVGVDHPELMSPESYAKMLETAKHHRAAYRLAVKSGVKIALGTDLGISTPVSHPLALGRSGGELSYAVSDGGMTPLQAIEAATAMGPETLGGLGMAPRSGQIKEGYDADLIALRANPLDDLDILKDPANVTHVWKAGRCFKSP